MQLSSWIFDGWHGPLRTLTLGVLAYGALICALRISGKRTLSKMNAFDLVVTVALGSTLASALVTDGVSLAQAATAFAVLIGLQYVVAFVSARSDGFRRVMKSAPTLLAYRGELLRYNMRRERIAVDEVRAALRQHGYLSLDDVEAVVLETEGTLSVMPRSEFGEMPRVLDGVRTQPPVAESAALHAAVAQSGR